MLGRRAIPLRAQKPTSSVQATATVYLCMSAVTLSTTALAVKTRRAATVIPVQASTAVTPPVFVSTPATCVISTTTARSKTTSCSATSPVRTAARATDSPTAVLKLSKPRGSRR